MDVDTQQEKTTTSDYCKDVSMSSTPGNKRKRSAEEDVDLLGADTSKKSKAKDETLNCLITMLDDMQLHTTEVERFRQLLKMLPEKVQETIFEYTFTVPENETIHLNDKSLKPPAVLQVNRKARKALSEQYYTQNKFYMATTTTIRFEKMMRWFKSVPKEFRGRVNEGNGEWTWESALAHQGTEKKGKTSMDCQIRDDMPLWLRRLVAQRQSRTETG